MKISIITPCLNSVDTIERSIKSVIGQKICDLEYIIVDGGSTDGTVEIIKKYNDNISKWVSEPDNGLYDAMNKGITMATGDIISILGSDDWYEKNVFQVVETAFEENDCDFVCGDYNFIDNENRAMYQDASKFTLERIYIEMIYGFSTIFCKKKFYNHNNNFNTDYKIAADYDWVLRTIKRGVKLHYIHQPIFNFSYGGTSTLNKKSCARETRDISLKHLPSEKTYYAKEIDERYYTSLGYSSNAEERNTLLIQKLSPKVDNIIWGAGLYGKQCIDWLNELNMNIGFVIDTNFSYLGKKIKKISICSPDVLKNFNGNLIITPERYVKEIKAKISEFNNPNINVISMKELAFDIGKNMAQI